MKHQTLVTEYFQYVVATSQVEANETAKLIGHTTLEEAQKHLDELALPRYKIFRVYPEDYR